jgi:hypothetical protein
LTSFPRKSYLFRMNAITNLTSQQLRQAAELKDRIAGLQKQLGQVLGSSAPALSSAAPKTRKKLSPAAIGKIRAAAKARWAKVRASKAGSTASAPAKAPAKKGGMSAAAKAKLSAKMKTLWAARRAKAGGTATASAKAPAKKGGMSAAAKAKLSAKMKAVWAARKAGKKK